MLGRQRRQRRQHLLRVPAERDLGRRGGVGGRVARLAPRGPDPRPVDRAVGDDRPQPRAEPAPAIEPVKPPDRGQERLLRDVLGGGVIVHDQERRPVGAWPEAPEQRLEIGLGPGERAADERLLAPRPASARAPQLAGYRDALRRHRQGFTWPEHDRCTSSPLRI